jgi:hypothetical protein
MQPDRLPTQSSADPIVCRPNRLPTQSSADPIVCNPIVCRPDLPLLDLEDDPNLHVSDVMTGLGIKPKGRRDKIGRTHEDTGNSDDGTV